MNIQTCPKGHFFDGDVTAVCPICEPKKQKEEPQVHLRRTAQIRCANCQNILNEGELYCRNCGTKRGGGAFRPEKNIMEMKFVYGPPPVSRTHKCRKCGNEWKSFDINRHCPRCGSNDILLEVGKTGWRFLRQETEEQERREKEGK